MIIGIPKEIKDLEFRVGATPEVVRALKEHGHEILVETQAGAAVGFDDEAYRAAGASIVASAEEVWKRAAMVIKVKEPQPVEFELLREGLILFCYLHLSPDPVQTKALIEKKVIGVAYETVTDVHGQLPLLQPMSEVAGRLAIQAGAHCLQMSQGGRGVLLGGVPGVAPAKVTIIGGGVSGTEAARMAMGLGADVTLLDTNLHRLRKLDLEFGPLLKTLYSSSETIEKMVLQSDLVVGAVLLAGKRAPILIKRSLMKRMAKGSVFVDISIDQGGCAETSRPTTHSQPTYVEEGVIHYCVSNMPAACARTSTLALTHATLQPALELANKGVEQALKDNIHLRRGLNVYLGSVTNAAVAADLGYTYLPAEKALGIDK